MYVVTSYCTEHSPRRFRRRGLFLRQAPLIIIGSGSKLLQLCLGESGVEWPSEKAIYRNAMMYSAQGNACSCCKGVRWQAPTPRHLSLS